MLPTWPKRILFGQAGAAVEKGRKTGVPHGEIAEGFGPPPLPGQNSVAGRPLRPRFYPGSADHTDADPCPAGIRHAPRLGDRPAGQRNRLGRFPAGETGATAGGREIDVVLVWRLDRWGRSVTDLLATLQELEHMGVGFVSLTEALDLTTPAGRAMAALLAVFAEFEREILRERVRAGLAHARQNGQRLGRPLTAGLHAAHVRKLYRAGTSKSEIARRLEIGRTSVRRILAANRR